MSQKNVHEQYFINFDLFQQEETLEPPDPAAISRHKRQFPKIVINIGGVKHEVWFGRDDQNVNFKNSQ